MSYFNVGWEDTNVPVRIITDEKVNPFASQGLTMAAIAGCTLPFGSLKFLAALGLLKHAELYGALSNKKKYIEATSGCMGNALVQLFPDFGVPVENLDLVMNADVPPAKEWAPRVSGANVINPTPGKSTIEHARQEGGGWVDNAWDISRETINLDQYACPGVYAFYRDWLVPKILDAFAEFDYLVCPVGTGGTILGLSKGLRAEFGDKIKIVGAVCAPGEEIPGMRTLLKSSPPEVLHPWRDWVNEIIDVKRKESFLCAPQVDRSIGISTGPSGGGTYAASRKLLKAEVDAGKDLHGKKLLFVIHDIMAPYAEGYREFSLEDLRADKAPSPSELIFGGK